MAEDSRCHSKSTTIKKSYVSSIRHSEMVSHSGTRVDTPSEDSSIYEYICQRSPQFVQLSNLRKLGWENPAGDAFFAAQRSKADKYSEKTARFFFGMMERIGTDLHRASGAFKLSSTQDPWILDFCAAPGGFLQTASSLNPGAHTVGFSLPSHEGGHALRLPERLASTVKFLDLTMLAADMGMQNLPQDHQDVHNFLPRELSSEMVFDLVICDGQVLRTQHLPSYREGREARRLTVTQLALGLEHMRPGGTMVVLLHKVEAWETILTLRLFSEISTMALFKPVKYHAKRSSFYLVAKEIATEHPSVRCAIDEWKRMWTLATFGPQEELDDMIRGRKATLPGVLEEFGPELIQHGEAIWRVQANALLDADFIRHGSASS